MASFSKYRREHFCSNGTKKSLVLVILGQADLKVININQE